MEVAISLFCFLAAVVPLIHTETTNCHIPAFVATEATAVLTGDNSLDIFGTILFTETNGLGAVTLTGTISNLTKGEHGFHIHAGGNIRDGCDGAGDHYNPDGYTHSGLNDAQRHAGDLGNIFANGKGIATVDIQDIAFTLNGEYSVVGRTLVVHQDPDDYGRGGESDSAKSGHSGKRIACGVIGISAEKRADA
ncbi:putative Superoxide dismutase (Cu-Zn) [Hypsibius exemplaris]|uniref:Superoxide dismutase [Cu-Zn] n=1 Tax=Hypsibius exemplaris TaxID=2072580 RepID=A0A9X6NHV0_HYPEX|nr:putative Superoxide dismutase (Cu-Zn) [Hypsibius exemplaris]